MYVVHTIGGLDDWPTIDPSWIPPGVVVPPGLVTPQPSTPPTTTAPSKDHVGVALLALAAGLAIGAVAMGIYERRSRRR